ncbi:UDP-glucuronate:xylan alpha-glucuronosyltransferase 2 [Dorcoceras hygrometricum]|uniref:UDP-glucuronate:xylan alpha-glucuronosyltransferase 2 n=1 Tax=Dorcoceras hygrometricum TaxID=472368 RepID=A0A2Z7AF85_9LAMI|nr:UDP-glucuronate:xylan alpha-glucuronosyltransferase 2 [Dorcoceras hygrometricum]
MASSLISNINQVYFASVLGMDNEGMVAMFEALISSGLNGFLGCSSAIYEATLVEFFQNASVRDGQVVSTVQGKPVEISEELFARTFDLPMEGLTDMHEVPKDLVFDARSEFYFNGEQLSTSYKKREMKIEFRLLNDILAKSVTVKAESFDAVMVTPGSRQAKGYAVQICTLLKNVPDLELGDSKEFPPLKILTAKTVIRYIAINNKIDVEDVEDEPRVKKTPMKKDMSRKRPVAAVVEPVVKRKRTLVGKAADVAKDSALVTVAQEAVPLQIIAPIFDVPPAPKRKAPKRKLRLEPGSDDETIEKEPTVEEPVLDTSVETAKLLELEITGQILADTTRMEADAGETDVGEQIVQKSEETVSQCDLSAAYFVEEPIEETGKNQGTEISDVVQTTDEESMSLDELLATIPHGSVLPSTVGEITKIQFGRNITIRGFNEGDWYKACLPKIPVADKGKAPLHERDPIKGHPAREIFSLICADIELLIQFREKIIDELEQFFNSFSLHRLLALKSDEDIYAKEEQVLIWAETDSTRVALQRRMYILIKYRELLLRKFLQTRRSNFISGQSFSAIDLKVLDMLSNLHMFVLEELKTQMREHGLQWELTCCSRLFKVDHTAQEPLVQGDPDLIADTVEPIVQVALDYIPTDTAFDQDGNQRSDSSSSSSSSHDLMDVHVDTPVHFTSEDIPLGIETAVAPTLPPTTAITPPNFSKSFAQIRESISQLYDRQARTQRGIENLGHINLSQVTHLETAFADAFTQQDQTFRGVLKSVCQDVRNEINVLSVQLNEFKKAVRTQGVLLTTDVADVRKEVKEQKAELFKELDERLATIRSDSLDFHAQAQENHLNLSTQLGYLVDYINRGGDAKKGESSSSLLRMIKT